MARSNLNVEPQEFVDILDEEFYRYLEVAQTLIKSLKRQKDKDVGAKYVRKCTELNVPSIEVKSNRNDFFKYFLKMLQTAAANQPPQYDSWFKAKEVSRKKEKETSYFTPDRRTYVAAKMIPGVGTLVYMAVAYDTSLGWQPYGFCSYNM